MPDMFDERLAAGAVLLEQEAVVGSPAGVRARGDQRRRRHTATMAVVPVAVLAIAGSVGLTLRGSGGSSGPGVGGTPPVSGVRTTAAGPTPTTAPTPPTATTPRTSAPAATSVATADLTRHTLTVLDAQGKVVRTLEITAGAPAYPTRTGTFTVVDKKPTKQIASSTVGADGYVLSVSSFIDLGPNAPAIYAMPWRPADDFGKRDTTHGDIGLSPDDATWLYNRLAVGDTVRVDNAGR